MKFNVWIIQDSNSELSNISYQVYSIVNDAIFSDLVEVELLIINTFYKTSGLHVMVYWSSNLHVATQISRINLLLTLIKTKNFISKNLAACQSSQTRS